MSWDAYDRLHEEDQRMREMEEDFRDEIAEPYETKLESARDYYAGILEMTYGLQEFDPEQLYFLLEQLAHSIDAHAYFSKVVDQTQEKMAIRGK